MSYIRAYKYNEVYFQLDGDTSALMDIADHFKWKAANAKYHPRVKAKIWDGFVSLLEKNGCLFPIGMYWELARFCKSWGFDLVADMEPVSPGSITRPDIVNLFDWISIDDPWNPGQKMDIRSYQMETVYRCLRHRRVNVISPTSSGKTVMIYAIARYLEALKKRLVVVVPNISLVSQGAGDFASYGYEREVGQISGGADKRLVHQTTFTTWQSLQVTMKRNPSWFEQIDAFIADEAHGVKENAVVTKMLKLCVNAKWRFGFTGTFPEQELTEKSLIGLIGPKFVSTTITELEDSGHVAPLKINICGIDYPKEAKALLNKMKKDAAPATRYRVEKQFIMERFTDHRNKKIGDIIEKQVKKDENALVLFEGNVYGRSIEQALEKRFPDKNVFIIYGDIKDDEREAIKEVMKKTGGNILVASYGTFSTGINIPYINHMVFASSSKSMIRVIQSIGRGIRLHSSKKYAYLWDLVDDFGKRSYSMKHMVERLRIYTSVGYDYRFGEL